MVKLSLKLKQQSYDIFYDKFLGKKEWLCHMVK